MKKIAMACYFNLGIDAEVGVFFEKKRTNQRLCNKILYGLEGVKKAFQIK